MNESSKAWQQYHKKMMRKLGKEIKDFVDNIADKEK